MTTRPRAIAEDFYRRFNIGERVAKDYFHPDIDWHWPRATPGAGVYHGHEGIDRGLELWVESWGEFRMEPDEFIEAGDELLVMVRYKLRGAESGIDFEHPVAHLLRVEDGLIRSWWMFGDPQKARERFLAGDRPG